MTKILNETLLTSEFTFGFELEGIVSGSSNLFDEWAENVDMNAYDMNEDDKDNAIKDYFDYQLYSKFNKHLTNRHISSDSSVHGDSSVHSNTDYSHDYPFEYSSPVLSAVPENFARVIHLLKHLKDYKIYTNNTCGFHHHVKFNGMTPQDLVWIYCNLATDAEAFELFSKFKNYKFFDETFASFEDIDKLGEALLERDFERAIEYITDEKYRAFRIHPQGTLEWRGPRDFLNNDNIEYITDFYKLFNVLITKIKHYMDMDVLADTTITKEELFKKLKELDYDYGDLVDDSNMPESKGIKKLIERITINPSLILKIATIPELEAYFKKIFETYNYRMKIIAVMKQMAEYKLMPEDKLSKILRYLKNIALEMRFSNQEAVYNEFSLYGLEKYAYTGKELLEVLDSQRRPGDYLSFAYHLVRSNIVSLDKRAIWRKLYGMIDSQSGAGGDDVTMAVSTAFSFIYTVCQMSADLVLNDKDIVDLIMLTLRKLYATGVNVGNMHSGGRIPSAMHDVLRASYTHYRVLIKQYALEEWNTLVKNMEDFKTGEDYKDFLLSQ